jgi:hypothetical protein
MKYIVARIHNNSLGSVIEVSSQEEGKDIIRGMAEEQFNRPLTDDEIDHLEDNLEIYNEEDSDNIFCFSLGIIG